MAEDKKLYTLGGLSAEGLEQLFVGSGEELKKHFEESKEEFKEAIYKNIAEFMANFFMFIVDIFYKAGVLLGKPFGAYSVGVEEGKQEILREHKIYIPSIQEIIDLNIKGFLDGYTASDLLDRAGVSWDYISALYEDIIRKASPEVLSNLCWRGVINKEEFYRLCEVQGLDRYQAELILEAHRILPNPTDLIYTFKKWGYSDNEILEALGWLGLHGWAKLVTFESYYKIPSIQDIIRFMVREAFNPYAIDRYKMLEEFPEDAVKYAEIQGLTRDWLEKYWIAHWDLPSPTMVFDMYHRVDKEAGEDKEPIQSPYSGEVRYRHISKQVVNDYLKFADILHYWRDKMLRISNNVLTRVDIRRMYELGIFTEDDVYFSYIEQGYSEEHAKALTDFTILEVMSEEINKVRNELIEAYCDGAIDINELRQYLLDLHINPQIVELLLAYAEWKKANDIRGKILSAIRERFIEGDLDEVGVSTELAKWGFRVEEINRYLDIWAEERRARRRYLTKTEIIKAYQRGIFSREEAKKRLVVYGYTEEDAEVLLKLAGDYVLQ